MSGRSTVVHVPKPWGHETIWAHTDQYVGKILHIKAGEALSVQYHNVKDETVYLLSGRLIYRVWANEEPRDVQLEIGESFRITGHLKEKVEEYARAKCPFDAVFIEQKIQDGTAGAVALARDYVDQPVFIIFVDTIFDADLSLVKRVKADGIIWVKEVDDYQRF